MENKLSVGEQRVRTQFNPSKRDTVDKIKQLSAELINIFEELKSKDARLASLAQTTVEEAAMWGVKAATADMDTTARSTVSTGTGPIQVPLA